MKFPVPPAGQGGPQDRFNKEVVDVLRELLIPSGPVRLWSVASADLPPAADWTAHAVWVSDQSVVAVSDGTNWISTEDGSSL